MNRATFLLIVGFLALAAPGVFADSDRASDIDEIFASFTEPGSPGAAVAVIHDGEVVFSRGYGLANIELGVPITPQSVFYLGSVSKQFVAASIALLEQEGKLSLDDDIRKYVPELPDYGTPITVRHLVHHTSGLRDYLGLMNLAGLPLGTFHDNQGVVDLIARQKALNFQPGEEYLYSNSGYFLLAVIVEKASGQSLRRYAQEKIFEPLGMKNTHFHDDYAHLIPNRASGYFPDSRDGYRNFLSTFDRVGSGGVFSSVEDLFLWDQNFYEPRVGGKELLERMHETGKLNDGQELEYAFGLTVGERNGLQVVQHGGALGGYRSMLARVPAERFSVIVLANVSSAQPGALAMQVADLYLADRYASSGDDEAVASNPPEAPKPVDVPGEDLERVAGHYWNRDGSYSRRIYVNHDGKLMYWRSMMSQSTLAPLGGNRFRMLDVGARVEVAFKGVEDAKGGKPIRLVVTIDDEEPVVSEAYEPTKTTPSYLEAFVGTYHSVELLADYELLARGGALVSRGPDGEETPLLPGPVDVFMVRGGAVCFTRGENDDVDGFVLDAGRVKGLRFDRR